MNRMSDFSSSDCISRQAAKDYIDSQEGRPFIGCTIGEAMKIMLDEVPPAQQWNKCIGKPPKNKSNVLTAIYIPGRQPHVRSGWFEDGLFMNDNGDTWKWTDKEVIAWMYQPKLPEPWGGAQDDTD